MVGVEIDENMDILYEIFYELNSGWFEFCRE